MVNNYLENFHLLLDIEINKEIKLNLDINQISLFDGKTEERL